VLNNFFLTCSGVDKTLIDNCANGEQNKYVGIGATVFFTAIMATIAGSYALYTVFDNLYAALFFGLIWGLLIFNLDRFIIATIKKSDSKWKEFLQVSPRIVLAVIIAIVISKPLELKLFEKEINQVLLTEKNQMTLENKTQIAQQFTP
jgi:Mn2+/Fe2+ NRAMP family transporter